MISIDWKTPQEKETSACPLANSLRLLNWRFDGLIISVLRRMQQVYRTKPAFLESCKREKTKKESESRRFQPPTHIVSPRAFRRKASRSRCPSSSPPSRGFPRRRRSSPGRKCAVSRREGPVGSASGRLRRMGLKKVRRLMSTKWRGYGKRAGLRTNRWWARHLDVPGKPPRHKGLRVS